MSTAGFTLHLYAVHITIRGSTPVHRMQGLGCRIVRVIWIVTGGSKTPIITR